MGIKYLLVGLGNIGAEYIDTRHNVGFAAIDDIAAKTSIICVHKPKFCAEIGTTKIHGHSIIVAKPSTFMNLSGKAVSIICAYHKINANDIFVIHDDIDLELGKIKIKLGGGSAGHNGLKSIDAYIGTNYHRIRVGVGRPLNFNIDIADYVLSKFTPAEHQVIMQSIQLISDNIHLLFNKKIEEFKKQISSL